MLAVARRNTVPLTLRGRPSRAIRTYDRKSQPLEQRLDLRFSKLCWDMSANSHRIQLPDWDQCRIPCIGGQWRTQFRSILSRERQPDEVQRTYLKETSTPLDTKLRAETLQKSKRMNQPSCSFRLSPVVLGSILTDHVHGAEPGHFDLSYFFDHGLVFERSLNNLIIVPSFELRPRLRHWNNPVRTVMCDIFCSLRTHRTISAFASFY